MKPSDYSPRSSASSAQRAGRRSSRLRRARPCTGARAPWPVPRQLRATNRRRRRSLCGSAAPTWHAAAGSTRRVRPRARASSIGHWVHRPWERTRRATTGSATRFTSSPPEPRPGEARPTQRGACGRREQEAAAAERRHPGAARHRRARPRHNRARARRPCAGGGVAWRRAAARRAREPPAGAPRARRGARTARPLRRRPTTSYGRRCSSPSAQATSRRRSCRG